MPRNSTPLTLQISVPPGRGPASSRLAAAIVRAIAEGQFKDGDPLPSTRTLAVGTGIARSVVVSAYEELGAAGYVRSTPGSMTTVEAGAGVASRSGAYSSSILTGGERRRRVSPVMREVVRYDLTPGFPDPALLNRRTWASAWRSAQRQAFEEGSESEMVSDGRHHDFHPQLQRELTEHLRRNRGIVCQADEIFIFPGVNAAVATLVHALELGGRTIAFEDPGFVNARRALTMSGASVRHCPVDESGLTVRALTSEDAAVYVTPAHQYPLGFRMPVDRRAALLDWAVRHDGLVIEDDYDGEFRYGVPPMPALRSMDAGHQHVIYLGTTSKILHRSVRIAWAVLPGRLADRMRAYLFDAGDSVSGPSAYAVAEFIRTGALTRQLAASTRTYAARQHRFTAACRDRLPGATLLGVEAGLHMVVELAEGTDDVEVASQLLVRGLACASLSRFYAEGSTTPRRAGLVCGYARLPETQADEAAQLISLAVAGL